MILTFAVSSICSITWRLSSGHSDVFSASSVRFCTRSCVLICITSTISSTTHSEARSCGITLTHAWRPLLCVVNVGLLDHFIRFFIRGLLTHIFHHVTLILCEHWCSRMKSLSDGIDILQSQPRVFSLSVIALTSPLSFNFSRWFTTADTSVFTFVSVWTRHRLS